MTDRPDMTPAMRAADVPAWARKNVQAADALPSAVRTIHGLPSSRVVLSVLIHHYFRVVSSRSPRRREQHDSPL